MVRNAITGLLMLLMGLVGAMTGPAAASPFVMKIDDTVYNVDPQTLSINARLPDGAVVAVMPPLYPAQDIKLIGDGSSPHWTDSAGRDLVLTAEGNALRLTITGKAGEKLAWDLPAAKGGTWLVPDGEGMAYAVADPFWRTGYYAKERCMGGTTALSFPAWSYLTKSRAVTYTLGDGLQSELCLRDQEGLQARLKHEFRSGADKVEILFAIRPPEPLAPALFYREVLKERGQFKSFADKAVPDLPRLFGAPHAYLWGDGRDLAFLDDLKALGIDRILLSYDQDPRTSKFLVTPDYLKKAAALGYLAGPYDAFDNGQPEPTADMPAAIWPGDLYPAGCITEADGKPKTGFANRGCYMSSEAIARYPGPSIPGQRYAGHIADGANHVFLDVDAFGDFFDDYSPDHPMTMTQDRANRLTRMGLGITRYKLVLGSENVTAWASGVTHYSHGTALAHSAAIWPLHKNPKFGGYWPPERPPLFLTPFTPTADEARALFGAADRLPLFEAVFHDSVVAVDRWEFGLMKVTGEERLRFARSLLYGTPTMWNLDRRELARIGPWLKAAEDDFRQAHGVETPVALTGFRWLTDDRLVQQTTYADGRVLTANFSGAPWQGLGPDCVRVALPDQAPAEMCPPADPPAFK
jgi:hypothetical protein